MSCSCMIALLLAATGSIQAATYYLDCSAGNDSADGRSPETAWRTRGAFQAMVFAPGDSLLLRRGTRCAGMLTPAGSGTQDAPITIGAYGDGPAPVIDGGSQESALRLYNQQGWHIENIETTGGVRYGLHITGDTTPMSHFRITNVAVHDVYGSLTSKRSGLIVLDAFKAATINDVIIDGVTAWNTTQWAGIKVSGAENSSAIEGPHGSNITIRNSLVHDVYGDGIILFVVQNGLIEKSAAWRIGQQPQKTIGTPNAIWTWMCNECTVQFNESWLASSPENDGGAFDIDWGDRNNVVRFNYGHESKSYCAAIFGAERLATTGDIYDNLCIANSSGPKVGADFAYYTWNSGWVAGSSIDHNVSCLIASPDSPAIRVTTQYNAADLRGNNRFDHNTVYSSGTLLVDASKPLLLDYNSYWSASSKPAAFRFDGHGYDSFAAYQAGSGQDANGKHEAPAIAEDALSRLPPDVLAEYRGAPLLVSILDRGPGSLSQSVVLRSMEAQYGGRGLQVVVGGDPAPEWRLDGVALGGGGDLAAALDAQRLPATFLVDAQGTILARWDGYAPFFAVGPAVSRAVGAELVPGCPAERAMRGPRISAVDTPSGTTAGALVTIRGSNFAGEDRELAAPRVYFGAVAAEPISITGNELTAAVPGNLTAGPVRVQVEYRGVGSNSVVITPATAAAAQPARGRTR